MRCCEFRLCARPGKANRAGHWRFAPAWRHERLAYSLAARFHWGQTNETPSGLATFCSGQGLVDVRIFMR